MSLCSKWQQLAVARFDHFHFDLLVDVGFDLDGLLTLVHRELHFLQSSSKLGEGLNQKYFRRQYLN